MSRDAPKEKSTRLGCPMQGNCKLGEGEEDGGQYLTPADLSTHADILAMLTLHLESHRKRGTLEDRPRATRAQKAKVPKLDMNLADQVWEMWKSNWVQTLRQTRGQPQLPVQPLGLLQPRPPHSYRAFFWQMLNFIIHCFLSKVLKLGV